MKKLLIGGVVAVLCAGVSVVYADDAHHPGQGSAPAAKQAPAPDKPMGGEKCDGAADAPMGKAEERMKQAQALMAKLREAKNPAERQKLAREHAQALHDIMGMMRGMKMGMMGGGHAMGGGHEKGAMDCCQGAGGCQEAGCGHEMGGGHGKGAAGGAHGMDMMGMMMMGMHQMMEGRMEMMQMLVEQMLERQEVLMRDAK